MATQRRMIDANLVRNAVVELLTRGYAPLDPRDCHELPIVEVLPSGYVDIVDGYHRIAAMIMGGAEQIPCIVCDDEDLICDAGNAEDPSRQRAAVKKIYQMAK